ncbi:helix-turn-helix domain-containing protein [Nocardia heshunensis]
MVDVASVRTPEDLRAALKSLLASKHLSYDAVVRKAGGRVGKTTLSDILGGRTGLPRWDTLREVLAVCEVTGAQLDAWETAHRLAGDGGIGVPLETITNPFALEVHEPITVTTVADVAALPTYVHRQHDKTLAELVDRAVNGHSAIAVFVAGSSAGKTRALWEGLKPLRLAGGWRLWHPVSPTRPEALDQLDRVRPRTVLWLNETQRYLTEDQGDRVATALDTLLGDTTRAPVLIVGTLWPADFQRLCRDPAAATTKLLKRNAIEVPTAFAGTELDAVREAASEDPRLAMAVEHAEDDQITQYLAGGPELIHRYRFPGSPATRAVIDVAMDAIRLGHRNQLPYRLLRDAAPYYLAGVDRDSLDPGWFDDTLVETSRPCKGVRGPITRISSPAVPSRDDHDPDAGSFQLADFLDHHGRTDRAEVVPPLGFWEVLAHLADRRDLVSLGEQAQKLGLYRIAAQLWKNAAAGSNTQAATLLVRYLPDSDHEESRMATWVLDHAALVDPHFADSLLRQLWLRGATEPARKLAWRIVNTIPLTDTYDLARLSAVLIEVGAIRQSRRFAGRVSAECLPADVDDTVGLLHALQRMGAVRQARKLARRVVPGLSPAAPSDNADLLRELRKLGMTRAAMIFTRRASSEFNGAGAGELKKLLEEVRKLGAVAEYRDLVDHAATTVSFDDVDSTADLLMELGLWREIDQNVDLATRAVEALTEQGLEGAAAALRCVREMGGSFEEGSGVMAFIDQQRFGDADAAATLLAELRKFGGIADYHQLAERATTEVVVNSGEVILQAAQIIQQAGGEVDEYRELLREAAANELPDETTSGVIRLLENLREAGERERYQELAQRAAATNPLTAGYKVGRLLHELKRSGAVDQYQLLVHRAVTGIRMENITNVTWLLEALRELGELNQYDVLAQRAVGGIELDDPKNLSKLLRELRECGSNQRYAELARRVAAAMALPHVYSVALVLDELRLGGADEYVEELQKRVQATGLKMGAVASGYRALSADDDWYGREPDGSAAEPWSWRDLS